MAKKAIVSAYYDSIMINFPGISGFSYFFQTLLIANIIFGKK